MSTSSHTQNPSDQKSTLVLQCGARALDLHSPKVMGILNITPDSFSDGGQFYNSSGVDISRVLSRAHDMVANGAAIIDVGGESTRPGAAEVSCAEEMDRVLPVIERLTKDLDVIVSVDSSSPALIKEAASLGVGLINDVRALQRPGAIEVVAESRLPVCLMHMQGKPGDMQNAPKYNDVLGDVSAFLKHRISVCETSGIATSNILVDPGFGFGKTLAHNLHLLRELNALSALGCPILVGLSRKSMLGQMLQRDANQRLAGSIALALLAVKNGAHILRVHDVVETVDAIKVWQAVDGEIK